MPNNNPFLGFDESIRTAAAAQILYDISCMPWDNIRDEHSEFAELIEEALSVEPETTAKKILAFLLGVPTEDVTGMIIGFYCAEADNQEL